MKTKLSLSILSVLFAVLIIFSCKKPDASLADTGSYSGSPSLPDTPDDYKNSFNDHMAALGRVLFYDKNLSLNNSVSCGTCHQQERAFCDNLQFSPGVENLKTARNTPSIFAKVGRVFWDGRSSSMNDLALRPVKNHIEMKFEDIQKLSKKLSGLAYYPALFKKAFPNKEIDSTTIKAALAEFLKNFDFSTNKFSLSRANKAKLTASESLGEVVFFSNGRCSHCHHIEKNRFFQDTTTGGYGTTNEGHNIGLNTLYADNGIGEVTGHNLDYGVFMTPALLNVEFTAPYMHDGRFKTLEEVVEHYNSGIQSHPNLDIVLRDVDAESLMSRNGFIEFSQAMLGKYDRNGDGFLDGLERAAIPPARLNLSPAEKRGLVDFLKTLSDRQIFTDPKYSNPFALK